MRYHVVLIMLQWSKIPSKNFFLFIATLPTKGDSEFSCAPYIKIFNQRLLHVENAPAAEGREMLPVQRPHSPKVECRGAMTTVF